MRSKLAPEETFWRDLATQFDETRARKEIDGRVEGARRAIALAKRILALRNAPGYQDFTQALTDIREHALRQLVSEGRTDQEMRVLQGKVQAYEDVLAVIGKEEARVEALEQGLEELQNQRAVFDRPKEKS